MRVLLIEDDELIAHGVVAGLRAHGLAVDSVGTAGLPKAALSTVNWDVVVLDLPDEDGMSLLKRLRAKGMTLPVLILTTQDAVEHRVAGLRAGVRPARPGLPL